MKTCILAAVAALSVAAASAQLTPRPGPWPMKYANSARTSQSVHPGASLGVVEAKFRAGGIPPGIAVDAHGRIYLGTTFYQPYWSGNTYVVALNQDFDYAWRRRVDPYVWGYNQGIDSFPAINRFNRVVINSGNSQLLRFTHDGSFIDMVSGNPQSSNDHSPAFLPDDSILHYQFQRLHKYDPEFNPVWSTLLFSTSEVAVSPNGDLAMGGVRTNEPHGSTDLTYLNPDGTIRWSRSSSNGSNAQAVFGPDGTLYQGASAFNPDGSVKWATGGSLIVALGKNGQHYSTVGLTVSARNSQTGAILWSKPVVGPGTSLLQGFAIDSRDRIYVASPNGYLFCLAPNGDVLFGSRLADSFEDAPIVGPKGSVLLVGRDSASSPYYVYMIR